jgi:hypothetical protein
MCVSPTDQSVGTTYLAEPTAHSGSYENVIYARIEDTFEIWQEGRIISWLRSVIFF